MSKAKISILKRDYKFLTNRFIENFKLRKRVYDLQIENEELKSELELYENGVYFSNENDKLQDRIDKTLDYINNCIGIEVKEELRRLLRGEDE